jgi:site-specific recombinase XerD
MNELVVADRASEWRRLKALVLDSVSSPITGRVYNLGLDEFIAWFTEEPRPAGFTKATVTAWRVALEARKLGPISINVRITAVRKLAVEAADNGLLAPELASGIARIKGVRSHGVRVGNWLSLRQAQALLNAPDVRTKKGLRDRAMFATLLGCGLRRSELADLTTKQAEAGGVSNLSARSLGVSRAAGERKIRTELFGIASQLRYDSYIRCSNSPPATRSSGLILGTSSTSKISKLPTGSA